MRTIIAPTDFSEESLHAVNYAADLAQNAKANLMLLHIVQMPVSFDAPLTQYEYDSIMQNAEDDLEQLKKELLIRTDNEVEITNKVAFSTMAIEMADICEERKPFMVVIGPGKTSLSDRLMFGRHTFSVIKNLHYPVLVVPKNAAFKHIKRIGLATDFKDIYEVPAETIGFLLEMFDAKLDVIHICKSEAEKITSAPALSILKQRLKGWDTEFHVLLEDSITSGLNNYLFESKDDLLIVIPREYGFVESLVHQSQSNKVAINPAVPVLALP